ncbi:RNA polymerase sigma factor [Crateriforma conspicua]|uniref:RNA polymerase sigma factor n=1 Tax=Crateriforma conspicua TaxID=2527996 RepID=UPI00118A5275|nr:sigma-70 family RNA polymerase sigma factor [Crateriforma conspicua]QDV62951.1 ECF RNA polymerase sigma factor RpoE [Crateriforma conspicua]
MNASDFSEDSMESIVDRFERPLLAYATRMMRGDRQSAQDAVQETFLRLCRADRRKIRSRLAAWLFFVCRTRVIDMQRTKSPQPIEAFETTLPDPGPPAEQLADESEQCDRLAAMIDRLSDRQQEILRLRMQGGLSYREIAEVTGLTVNNVGVQLHTAVRNLRQAFATQ